MKPKPSILRFVHSAYSKYARELHAHLRRRMGGPQQVDDVVQETFLRLLRFDNTEFMKNPQAYLYGIASHVVREFRMRGERERGRLEFDTRAMLEGAEYPEEIGTDALGEELNLRRQLDAALRRLPPGHRAVLLCIKRDGMSYKEAADATGFSVHTVEKYLFEAIGRLRTMEWDR